MESVLSNELILENIFSFLPTSNLLLQVNRLNHKWKKVAENLTNLKRNIFLKDENILSYCDMINNGGNKGHQNIHLSILIRFPYGSEQVKAKKIMATISKFGKAVRELDVRSSNCPVQLELFCKLLKECKNLKKLSIGMLLKSNLDNCVLQIFNEDPAIPFIHLKTIVFFGEDWNIERRPRIGLLMLLLQISPNIKEIYFKTALKLEELQSNETLATFPTFCQKLVYFKSTNLGPDLANYLIRNDFSSLKKLTLVDIKDLFPVSLLLVKFATQLTSLKLGLRNILGGDSVCGNFLHLPLMDKLETLNLNYRELEKEESKRPIVKFWDCTDNNKIFPGLTKFKVLIESYDFEENRLIAVESFQLATFLEIFAKNDQIPNHTHPIFPKIRKISGKVSGSDWDLYLEKMKINGENINLLKMMKTYFPNLEFSI